MDDTTVKMNVYNCIITIIIPWGWRLTLACM